MPIYLMALPALVYFFINNYIPMGGIIIAFKDYKYSQGILGSAWAGFDNFKYLFMTSDAWIITRNTLLYNLTFIILGNALAIIVAICLNEVRTKLVRKTYQTIILLPYLLSMVVISISCLVS